MGLWKLFPTSVLEGINDAGAYYYACYLSINAGTILKIKSTIEIDDTTFLL